jgi:hypothetical protein
MTLIIGSMLLFYAVFFWQAFKLKSQTDHDQ